MKDFTYYAPTEVVFGRDAENHIGRLVRKYGGHKVLVHYGGGSVVRSGLLDAVCAQLDITKVEIQCFCGLCVAQRQYLL